MKNLNQLLPVLTITGMIVLSPNGFAEMYKWVDADGNTHYTQQPPPDGVDGQTIAPPPDVNTEKANKELDNKLESFDKRREAELKHEEEAKKAADAAEAKKQECEKLRQQLAELQRPRITTTDEEGNRSRMPEEERQAAIKKVNEAITTRCNL